MKTTSRRFGRSLCGAAISVLTACQPEHLVCPAVGVAGLTLTVLDAANRTNLESEARVTISRIGVNSGTLTGSPRNAVRITSQPGSYSIAVTATGYQSVTDTVMLSQSGGQCPSIVPVSKEILLTRVQ